MLRFSWPVLRWPSLAGFGWPLRHNRAAHGQDAQSFQWLRSESDKHWEEGEDLSLLEFKTIEYKRKGYAIATDDQLRRIAKVPKREFIRRGINQHTLEKICEQEPVRVAKLAKCLEVLDAYWGKHPFEPTDRIARFRPW
jgi:uncharacterized protein (DUF2384 family)